MMGARSAAAPGLGPALVGEPVALHDVWHTTLHASGIRLRNATGWESR